MLQSNMYFKKFTKTPTPNFLKSHKSYLSVLQDEKLLPVLICWWKCFFDLPRGFICNNNCSNV